MACRRVGSARVWWLVHVCHRLAPDAVWGCCVCAPLQTCCALLHCSLLLLLQLLLWPSLLLPPLLLLLLRLRWPSLLLLLLLRLLWPSLLLLLPLPLLLLPPPPNPGIAPTVPQMAHLQRSGQPRRARSG